MRAGARAGGICPGNTAMEESLLMARNKERTSNAGMKLWGSRVEDICLLCQQE